LFGERENENDFRFETYNTQLEKLKITKKNPEKII